MIMKTACIYHNQDLDGWMSAAIVKHWFLTVNNECNILNLNSPKDKIEVTTKRIKGKEDNLIDNTLYFLGWDYGNEIPDLSEYDKVIMCDISFPLINMLEIADKLMDSETLESNFIWLDHHISAIKSNISVEADGIRNTKFAACELTWKYFFPDESMPEIVRLLGMYDSFRHKGTDEELKVLEFQYGARQVITNYEEAYKYLSRVLNESKDTPTTDMVIYNIWDAGEAIYQYLCTEAKQTYKNGFEIELLEDNNTEDESCLYFTRKFICINKERFNPINFGIDYHKDGYDGCACFHYANGMWNFSLYNDNGEVDCSVIAKQFGGGGHKGASGFRIDSLSKVFNNGTT